MSLNFSEPIKLEFPQGTNAYDTLASILGHYDLRIYVTDTAYIDVGRGSISAALRLVDVSPTFVGCVGTVGQFCDFSRCQLSGGGEHQNELPVNVMFNNVSLFANSAREGGIASLASRRETPFSIGNGVLISSDAKVLSGAQIGDGAVIAANAVVTGTVEPFTIYGGVPAKKIKDRFDQSTKDAISAVRWWNFDTDYIGNNLGNLQSLATDRNKKHAYHQPAPRIALKIGIQGGGVRDIEVLGFLHSDQLRPLSEAPAKVAAYISQLAGPGPYQWLANVWR